MASIYTVTIETKPSSGPVGQNTSTREIYIVTDTIQNALAIAKCQCNSNEEVTYIFRVSRDPYIDGNAVKDDD